jgi:DNA helicase HerA-like ATPase
MRSDELVTIAGKRGYGKTTAAKNILKNISRVLIWDPLGEYTEYGVQSYIPKTNTIAEYDAFLKRAWSMGNVFVCTDEADQVMPVERPLSQYANLITNLGRHRNIGMCNITRRIARLNKTVFSQSREVILFHHFMPNDIRYLAEFIPDADTLKNLKKYEYKAYLL